MLILRGSPALSVFRLQKLLDALTTAGLPVRAISAEFVHLAELAGELTAADLRWPLYIGPVAPELASAGPWAMPWISNRLRLPDGCPWDREQTHASLRKHLLEEAYEVYDALADGPTPAPAAISSLSRPFIP